ncbi:MAG: NADH-quinone oxidoreductase subunit G [Ignavibacteria bacterium]|nr:MAG: NADH-quinone oxidoreductase subunit G [Ignavibacteria bacterium]
MPKLTIDGKEIEFKQGQTVIEAARENGIEIPHFCWHPKLSVSGNCRMCLVEIEKMPKLAIACSTMAMDGMVVNVHSEKALEARNAVMEFILVNHPLDCPICDEAGECKLQDYAFKHSKGESRFVEEKNHKNKRVELGPRIMFDGERCISCSRCIRFSDEIAGQKQLTFIQRGDHVTITTFPGESFDNPYTLNTVDICPVGALTSKDFRFQSRVWELSSTDSVCIGCSTGCNIDIWTRDNKIQRLTPRTNEEVNSEWMCDDGRLNTFKFVNADNRVDGAFIRENGELRNAGWDEAYSYVAENLKKFKSDQIAFVASPFATTEDLYAFKKFAASFGVKEFFSFDHTVPGSGDALLMKEDKSPNNYALNLLGMKNSANNMERLIEMLNAGMLKAVYLLEEKFDFDFEGISALSKAEFVVAHSTNFNKITDNANVVFPAATYAEKHGTLINFNGRVQRLKVAVATKEVDASLDHDSKSKWERFGTEFDRWNQGHRFDALPSWKILTRLSAKTGKKMDYNMAEDIFEEAAGNISELKGLDYDKIGDLGYQLQKNEVEAV